MTTTTNVSELLANASETGFEDLTLVEPATYTLELDANKTKKAGVFIKGRILNPGPHQGKLVGCGQLTFNEKASGIALQNCIAMGLDKPTLEQLAAQFGGQLEPFLDAVAKYVRGRVVEAELKYNEYQGTVRNQFEIGKIKLVSAPPPPAIGEVPQAVAPVAPQPVAPQPVHVAPQPAMPAPAIAPQPAVAAVAPVPESGTAVITVDDPGF